MMATLLTAVPAFSLPTAGAGLRPCIAAPARGGIVLNSPQDSHSLPHVSCVSIREQRLFGGQPFPLVFTPDDAARAPSLESLAHEHRDTVLSAVHKYDAILLRGFRDSSTPEHFSAFVNALQLEGFEMGCSAAPRTNVAPGVFTANEAPPSERIPFHHEMAQCDERPAYVAFFCETPAAEGGATPIVPSHAVAAYARGAHPEFADKLASLGVRYARVLPDEDDPSSPIGKSWRSSFGATRAEAEAAMTAAGTSWEWLSEGGVRTVTKAMPAIVLHGTTGRETFFNAAIAASRVRSHRPCHPAPLCHSHIPPAIPHPR
jgi:hypothetical protein